MEVCRQDGKELEVHVLKGIDERWTDFAEISHKLPDSPSILSSKKAQQSSSESF